MKHYRLLEEDERGYRISRLAHTSLGAGTQEEIVRAQHEAAWRPEALRLLRAEIACKRPEAVDMPNVLV